MSNILIYEPNSIQKAQIISAARRSLIAADSLYHAWSAKQQENFRANMDDNARKRVERVLLDSLLDIQCCIDEVDKVWNDVSLSDLNILNWASLLTKGVGEDFIYLNEILAEGKSLLDYTTLFDYNYDDYLFQEQENKAEFPEYKGVNYYAYKHPTWVRLLIDDDFYYATFTSVATQLSDDIDEAGRDYIDQLIPHKLIEGKNHGKQEKGGICWDMVEDANGLERLLQELQYLWYTYIEERWLNISEANAKLAPAVYAQDNHWNFGPHRSFIFNNEDTIKKIRWRKFLSDCTPLMADYVEVEKQREQEVSDAKLFLDKHYCNLLENFDPNVVKLGQKRKFLMSSDVFDDLEKFRNDDEPNE